MEDVDIEGCVLSLWTDVTYRKLASCPHPDYNLCHSYLFKEGYMQAKSVTWRLVIVLIIAVGLQIACALTSPQATAVPTNAPAATRAPAQAQPTTPPSAPKEDGATLLNTRCTACHNLDRVKQAKKTSEQWKQTVTRMVGKGAKLNANEQTVLVEYLTKTFGP